MHHRSRCQNVVRRFGHLGSSLVASCVMSLPIYMCRKYTCRDFNVILCTNLGLEPHVHFISPDHVFKRFVLTLNIRSFSGPHVNYIVNIFVRIFKIFLKNQWQVNNYSPAIDYIEIFSLTPKTENLFNTR